MKHRLSARGCETAALLRSCLLLFTAGVLGQFEAFAAAPAWLPDADAWYSGSLPYDLLLPAQMALLMIMAVVAWNRRVRTGRCAAAHARVCAALRAVAVLYFAVMALRLGIILVNHAAQFWRHGAIPVAFHWVLALFLLVSARASALSIEPAKRRGFVFEEIDESPHGDVPVLAQALLRTSNYPANHP